MAYFMSSPMHDSHKCLETEPPAQQSAGSNAKRSLAVTCNSIMQQGIQHRRHVAREAGRALSAAPTWQGLAYGFSY